MWGVPKDLEKLPTRDREGGQCQALKGHEAIVEEAEVEEAVVEEAVAEQAVVEEAVVGWI